MNDRGQWDLQKEYKDPCLWLVDQLDPQDPEQSMCSLAHKALKDRVISKTSAVEASEVATRSQELNSGKVH